jgi:hypothetical protein
MNQDICDKLRAYSQAEKLPCAVALYIAADLNKDPIAVGQAADDLDVRISQCQLGLFGYAQKDSPFYRLLRINESLPQHLAQTIQSASIDQTITCDKLWQIAAQLGISRHEAGNAVHTLQIKVIQCQLGCF